MSDNKRFKLGDVVRSRRYPFGMSGVVVGYWETDTVRRGWPMVAWDDRPSGDGQPCNPAELIHEEEAFQ